MHQMHHAISVVHNDHAPLFTGCTPLYWWSTVVVDHCALGVENYIGLHKMVCTIVQPVHNATLVVHNVAQIVKHSCAPGAQRYIGLPRWSCTIVHRGHNAISVVHNGHAPLFTGCTTLYWWPTVLVHHRALGVECYIGQHRKAVHNCAPDAHCYIGLTRWLWTIVPCVHKATLVVHTGHAPLCTGCTLVVHHCAPGAQ